MIGQRCDLVNPVEGDAMEFTPVDRYAAETRCWHELDPSRGS